MRRSGSTLGVQMCLDFDFRLRLANVLGMLKVFFNMAYYIGEASSAPFSSLFPNYIKLVYLILGFVLLVN